MKNKKILVAIMLPLIWSITSCSNNTAQEISNDKVEENEDKVLLLLKTNCFTCHNPNLEINNRVAPPLFKIREHYLDKETTEEDFAKNIIHFINNPTEENSIMPGAVRNFGLMPKMSFKEDDLKLMASYLYKNDVSLDKWYAKWEKFEKEQTGKPQEINHEDLGRNIVNETKANLGKNLMAAIKEKGAAGAVEFCNTKAIPITDSMSVVLNAKVKRVSDKPRNPNNQANAEELAYIEMLKKAKITGEKYTPKIFENNSKIIGYYPIETNKMCLQCHGTPENQILSETLGKIKKLYPTDKAFGYGENEIRGIYVVEMLKK
jgi:cytochrome c551/c552